MGGDGITDFDMCGVQMQGLGGDAGDSWVASGVPQRPVSAADRELEDRMASLGAAWGPRN